MKATKRKSQTQRLAHSKRRMNGWKKNRGPVSSLGNTPHMVRRETLTMKLPKRKPQKFFPVLPHTFGDPRSRHFWEAMGKTALVAEAAQRAIRGRSKMTKDELVTALVEHEND